MGVNQLSKKLRPASETPDIFSSSDLLSGKRIGVDLSVILHKALGTEDGAGEFFVAPPYPNNEVIERCTRLCSYAKANNVKLVVSVDGAYHPMKEDENNKRNGDRDAALLLLRRDGSIRVGGRWSSSRTRTSPSLT